MDIKKIRELLEAKREEYEQPAFIAKDPVSIPHSFSLKQDIEISAFFAATLAWGNRTSIINSCTRLMQLMDRAPYQFIIHHKETDLRSFMQFTHRTFNATDLLYFIQWLHHFYSREESLEQAFFYKKGLTAEQALVHFHNTFFSLSDHPERTRKHVSTPAKKSACKRLNMFLRWMVRKNSAVDFGIWNALPASALMIPLDIHTGNVARKLGILERKPNDWQSVVLLTEFLKTLDAGDPVKYDYALFALGSEERYR